MYFERSIKFICIFYHLNRPINNRFTKIKTWIQHSYKSTHQSKWKYMWMMFWKKVNRHFLSTLQLISPIAFAILVLRKLVSFGNPFLFVSRYRVFVKTFTTLTLSGSLTWNHVRLFPTQFQAQLFTDVLEFRYKGTFCIQWAMWAYV